MPHRLLRCLLAVAVVTPCAVASANDVVVKIEPGSPLEKAIPFLQAGAECKGPLARNAATNAILAKSPNGELTVLGSFVVFGMKVDRIDLQVNGDEEMGESVAARYATSTPLKVIYKAAKLDKDGRRSFKGRHLEAGIMAAGEMPALHCVVAGSYDG